MYDAESVRVGRVTPITTPLLEGCEDSLETLTAPGIMKSAPSVASTIDVPNCVVSFKNVGLLATKGFVAIESLEARTLSDADLTAFLTNESVEGVQPVTKSVPSPLVSVTPPLIETETSSLL